MNLKTNKWSIIAVNIGLKYEKYTQSGLSFMPSYFMSKRKSILTNYNGVVSTDGLAPANSQPADIFWFYQYFLLSSLNIKGTLGSPHDGWYTKECGEYRKTNMYFETLNWTSFPWMWSILTILLCRNIYNSVSKEGKNRYIWLAKRERFPDLKYGNKNQILFVVKFPEKILLGLYNFNIFASHWGRT